MNVEITTASKSRERQSDAPAIVEVLTRDELARFGGTTLEDVLTRVPGLGGQSAERAIVGARPGQSATDTVPFNKGRATYLGLKVGFQITELQQLVDRVRMVGGERPRGPVGIAIPPRPEMLRGGLQLAKLSGPLTDLEILSGALVLLEGQNRG